MRSEQQVASMMIVPFLYGQLRIGWDDLDNYPERKTWRGLFVVVSIGYVPAVAVVGIFSMVDFIKLL